MFTLKKERALHRIKVRYVCTRKLRESRLAYLMAKLEAPTVELRSPSPKPDKLLDYRWTTEELPWLGADIHTPRVKMPGTMVSA